MKFSAIFLVISSLILYQSILGVNSRLAVRGNQFVLNCNTVFLAGVNFAWNSYGYDFGNGQYVANSQTTFSNWLNQVASNGGNTVRVWVHVEGNNTPNFDGNGYVTAPDSTGTLVSDMLSFLNAAKAKNIVVIFVLWNGALLRNQNSVNLFWDTGKLQSYINYALKPMVSGLKGHPALAAWEIINEPEGLVYNNNQNATNCFNTVPLANSGAGWTGLYIPMQLIQRFINWQAAAIHQTDSGALVTVGSWSEHSITDSRSDSRNYYTDLCLFSAGGQALGTLDFYQVHTYAPYGSYAPFKIAASGFSLTKPIVVGEFSSSCSGGMTANQQYSYAYNNGYGGALGWQYAGGYCSDSPSTLDAGYKALVG